MHDSLLARVTIAGSARRPWRHECWPSAPRYHGCGSCCLAPVATQNGGGEVGVSIVQQTLLGSAARARVKRPCADFSTTTPLSNIVEAATPITASSPPYAQPPRAARSASTGAPPPLSGCAPRDHARRHSQARVVGTRSLRRMISWFLRRKFHALGEYARGDRGVRTRTMMKGRPYSSNVRLMVAVG